MKAVVPPTSNGLRASAPPTATTASASGLCVSSSSSGNLARLPIGNLVVVELDDVSDLSIGAAGRSGDRQADGDHRPLARRAFNHHRPFVQLDQPFHQRQAEASTVIFAREVVADLRERPAQATEIVLADADAGV